MRGVDDISESSKFFLVESSVLPDVFQKVVLAKKLLAQGKVKNHSEAAERVAISRSTFYKYKDCVFTYESAMARQIATLSLELEDRAGVLASVLALLSGSGGNILTINQNIPVDSVAPVSISMRTDGLKPDLDAVVGRLSELDGVVNTRLLSE